MSAEAIARLHILLEDIEPAIWRRVEVPVTASLKMLHNIVQAAMGWENSHLWHFEAGDRRYGVPDPMSPESGMGAAKNVKLAALIDRGVSELFYTYDMGNDCGTPSPSKRSVLASTTSNTRASFKASAAARPRMSVA